MRKSQFTIISLSFIILSILFIAIKWLTLSSNSYNNIFSGKLLFEFGDRNYPTPRVNLSYCPSLYGKIAIFIAFVKSSYKTLVIS